MRNRIGVVKHIFFDFDGVFTDNSVYVSEEGREFVRASRFDGYGLRKLDEIGVTYCIVSSEVNPVAGWRAEKIGIEIYLDIANKLDFASQYADKNGFSLSESAFLGNDINDIQLLGAVGYPACVSDAWDGISDVCKFQTLRYGGHGAVREFCEHIYNTIEKKGDK